MHVHKNYQKTYIHEAIRINKENSGRKTENLQDILL